MSKRTVNEIDTGNALAARVILADPEKYAGLAAGVGDAVAIAPWQAWSSGHQTEEHRRTSRGS